MRGDADSPVSGPRILAVEESPEHATELGRLLERAGFDPSIARDGTEALHLVERWRPALVISTAVTQGIDGYELCRRIKDSGGDIPVILLTDWSGPEEAIKALECGADAFLSKPYSQEALLQRIQDALADGSPAPAQDNDGAVEVYCSGSVRRVTSGRARILGVLVSALESAADRHRQLRAANARLSEEAEGALASSRQYRAVLEDTADGIVVVGPDRTVTYANPAAATLFGRAAQELEGTQFALPLQGRGPSEVAIDRPDGRLVIAEIRVAPSQWDHDPAHVTSLRDITERKQLEDELRELSITDELTGLHNRRGFFNLSEQQLRVARRQGLGILLMLADLDGLKRINDDFGHEEGDRALTDTAHILRRTFRESDILARVGGDEFAVLLVGPSAEGAQIAVRRLRQNMDAHNEMHRREYQLSVSVGIVEHSSERFSSVDELMAEADRLMYMHKRAGRPPEAMHTR